MAFVQFTNVSLAFGDRDILQSASLFLSAGSKAALAGPNGAGKTTLLRIIAGDLAADSGDRAVQKDSRIAWLPQSGAMFRGCSIFAEAEKAYADIEALIIQRDEIGTTLAASSSDDKKTISLLERFQHLDETINESGYYRRRDRILEVLGGLGFDPDDLDRPIEELSGGWQMRVSLGKIILSNPDIMLLDEPTNYLDLEARDWLEAFLRDYSGGFVIVSHDRSFLDACVNEVYELLHGRLSRYAGNYSQYEQRRSQELESLFKEWEAQQEEIARLEDFIRRFRYQATKAAQVQSRVKQLEKIEPIIIPEGMKRMHFSFPPPPHCGKIALTIDGLSKAYGTKTVVDELSLSVDSGQKIAFVGRNGAGKSTLMRLIAGVDRQHAGSIRYGSGITSAYFSQDVADSLHEDLTVSQEVEGACPTQLIPSLRNLLGAFLFRGDDINKPVSVLSGGERSRLALLKLLLHPANLLVLDEPTNHLDLNSKDVLLEALRSFPGTVLFVSHDRFFIEELATHVLELRCGTSPRLFHGDYRYYLQKKDLEASQTEEAKPAVKAQERTGDQATGGLDNKSQREQDKKRKTEQRRLARREAELLEELDEMDGQRQRLREAMAAPENYSDGQRMRELQAELDRLERLSTERTCEWEDLASRLAEFADLQ